MVAAVVVVVVVVVVVGGGDGGESGRPTVARGTRATGPSAAIRAHTLNSKDERTV